MMIPHPPGTGLCRMSYTQGTYPTFVNRKIQGKYDKEEL